MKKTRKSDEQVESVLSGMTDKQRRFCEEYVIDWNATRAAKAAGYSEATAYSIGQENLKKPEIQNFIEEIQKDLSKLCGVSAAMAVNELKKIAFSSAANLRSDWSEVKNWDELSDDEKSIIAEVTTTKRTLNQEGESVMLEEKLHYKTYDKQKALEQLSKILGWNAAEKSENKSIVTVVQKSREEIEAELNEIKKRRG